MAGSRISPLLNTAKSYLEHARDDRGALSDRGLVAEAVITYGLGRLIELIDHVQKDLEQDLAEVAIVYDTITSEVAPLLGRPDADVFPALVEFCDDDSARPLTRGDRIDHAVVEMLAQRVVWITVTYQAGKGQPCLRVVEIVLTSSGQSVPRLRVTHQIDWADIPDNARARIVAKGEDKVRFQLYPSVSGAASARTSQS